MDEETLTVWLDTALLMLGGFILTTVLGIVGAFVATYIGQAMGWYQAGEGAGLIGAIVGSLIVLFVWGIFAPRDPQRV